MTAIFLSLLLLVLPFAALILTLHLIRLIYQQHSTKGSKLPRMPQGTFERIQQEAAIRERGSLKVSLQTEARLYQMLGNDGAMVANLTMLTRSRHPNRSEQWVWEKTIYDLERDRGYR